MAFSRDSPSSECKHLLVVQAFYRLKVPKHPSGATPRNLGNRSGTFFIQHGNEGQTGSRSFSPLNKKKVVLNK